VLPPLAQVALEEGETVARNLDAELEGRSLEVFTFHDKGLSSRSGPAAGSPTSPASPAADGWHLLKDLIEWEYRQSVTHLRGWDQVAL
jgi:NADH dehydrogenase FAD-containing subunit